MQCRHPQWCRLIKCFMVQSEACLEGTPQYQGQSVPTWQVSLHGEHRTQFWESVPWSQCVPSSECPLKTGFTVYWFSVPYSVTKYKMLLSKNFLPRQIRLYSFPRVLRHLNLGQSFFGMQFLKLHSQFKFNQIFPSHCKSRLLLNRPQNISLG